MFKTLDPSRDVVSQLSVVNEVIVFGPTLFSSSIANQKKTNMWVSGSASGSYYNAIYDNAFSLSSSTELMAITYGQSISSSYYALASAVNKPEKIKMYRLFAKNLLGDEDSLFSVGGVAKNELIFVAIRRSQYKDEVKKGSFAVQAVFSGSTFGANTIFNSASCFDTNADNSYTQGQRGDYATIYSGSNAVGLFYYQAGIAVLVPEAISCTSSVATNPGTFWSGTLDYGALVTTGSFTSVLNGVTSRFQNISIVNQSNLHSTFYFARALNDEFNYSSNPTFLDSSGRIVTTSGSNMTSTTYITKVGLLGENNELLAVAAISRPLKKSAELELSVKIRVDY